MNSIVSNTHQVAEIKASGVVGVFKAIAPRSFEKTFEGIATAEIVNAMKICIDGLTREQVNHGLNAVRDNGFCPDPAMFRKWCLGVQGFGTEQQRLAETFKGKHAALANIIRWVNDSNTAITTAEKEAYDRCYEMFNNLKWAKNVDRASYLAEEAFKDNYVAVVQEFAESGTKQAIWLPDPALTNDSKVSKGVSKDYLPKQSEQEKAWISSRVSELKGQGLSFAKSLFQATKEYRDLNAGSVA